MRLAVTASFYLKTPTSCLIKQEVGLFKGSMLVEDEQGKHG
jgi:hypothetical protein